jgi:DeoR/GlpR family transcriptional regulator of sugar metabolism
MSMNGEHRRAFIRRQLHGTAGVSTAELQETLGVSMMTVWRDLGALEKDGVLRRVHGGAVPVDGAAGPEPSFAAKAVRAAAAKQRIARAALAAQVRPGMTLALDGGSTVAALMPFLPVDAGLTLLTNSLEIVRQTPSGVGVACSGGLYREVSGTFVGPQAVRFFAEHRVDVAFVSATGLDAEEGLMDPNPLEIEVKRALCARATKVVLLIDAEKFGRRSTLPVLALTALDEVVCDGRPPRALAAALKAAGVKVWVA